MNNSLTFFGPEINRFTISEKEKKILNSKCNLLVYDPSILIFKKNETATIFLIRDYLEYSLLEENTVNLWNIFRKLTKSLPHEVSKIVSHNGINLLAADEFHSASFFNLLVRVDNLWTNFKLEHPDFNNLILLSDLNYLSKLALLHFNDVNQIKRTRNSINKFFRNFYLRLRNNYFLFKGILKAGRKENYFCAYQKHRNTIKLIDAYNEEGKINFQLDNLTEHLVPVENYLPGKYNTINKITEINDFPELDWIKSLNLRIIFQIAVLNFIEFRLDYIKPAGIILSRFFKNKIQAVLLPSWHGNIQRLIIENANKNNVKTVSVQHGITANNFYGLDKVYTNKNLNWGERDKNLLERINPDNSGKLIVTGSYNHNYPMERKQKQGKKIGILLQNLSYYTFQPELPRRYNPFEHTYEELLYMDQILKLIDVFETNSIIIRPHPTFQRDLFFEYCKSINLINDYEISIDRDINTFVDKVEYIILGTSTAILDMLFSGVTSIQYLPENFTLTKLIEKHDMDFSKYNLAFKARTFDDVKNLIDSRKTISLSDSEIIEKSAPFIKYFGSDALNNAKKQIELLINAA